MKKILAIALGVLAFAACTREAAPVKVDNSREVKFTTNINTFTMKAGETALEGKTVKVLAGAPLNTGSDAVVEGTSLNLTNKIYWQEGQEAKTTFASVYSADAEHNPTSMTVDYTITDDFGYHSTFMTATAKDVVPETTVALNYSHPFSKVVVKVTNNLSGNVAVSSVSLDGVVLSGVLDLATGTIELGADKVAAVAAAQANGDYAAIIMPQTVKPALVVVAGENAYRFVLADDFTFEANKSYTAAVTIEDGTVPVQEVPVDFTVTVTDWEDASAALAYEPETEPVGPQNPEVTALYILGEATDNGWALSTMPQFAKEGSVFTLTTNLAANKQFRLQTQNADWYPAIVKVKETGEPVYSESQAAWDANNSIWEHFSVAESGSYKLVFDAAAWTLSVTRLGDVVVPPLDVTELYLLGDACDTGWSINDMAAFTKEGNVFTLVAHLKNTGIFRFLCQKQPDTWYPALVKDETEGTVKYSQGAVDAEHFTVDVSGTYLITVDIAARTYSIVLQEADPEPEAPTWYVIGNVYDDDPTAEAWAVDFPLTKVEGIWTVTINVTGEFKFRAYTSTTAEADKWNTTLGMWKSDTNTYIDITNTYGLATDAQENKNIAFEEAGQYKLEINPEGNVLTTTKL